MIARRCLWVLLLCVACADAAERGTGPFTAPRRSLRSRHLDQLHVRLELRFDFNKQAFRGRAIHRLNLFRDVPTLDLDAAGMTIDRVGLATASQPEEEGTAQPEAAFAAAEFRHEADTLHITLPSGTARENLLVAVDYHVDQPQHGAHFVSPDPHEPGALTMVWTQSEPEFARYWYPCFDHPSDRLTSEIIATAPQEFFVLSNGVLKEKRSEPNGLQTWHWVQRQSHVPYLLSVVAGDFEAFEQQWDGIPVVSYVPRGRLPEAKLCFAKTPRMVKYFSEQIGYRYPWPKYTQICVDEYMWGGMEHTSATTLNLHTLHDERAYADEFFSTENLVAHELAHQWWGNLVTCKDWAELWLNESFATYFATLWTEHDLGWDEAAWDRRGDAQSYFAEDNRYRRSIVNYRYDRPESMFDSHTYPKGGRVLHMLRFELGDELFWKAIRRYVEVNHYRTVETADLRRAVEEATGQGMNWFFEQWLDRGGHPEFQVSWTYHDDARQVAVTIKQTQPVDSLTPLFRSHAELEIATSHDARIERVHITKAEETFHLPCEQRPTRVVFDPRDWLLDKLTQAKSRSELIDQLAHDEHMLARFEAAEGLAEQKDQPDAVAALHEAAEHDPFWAVRQEATRILGQLSGDEIRRLLCKLAIDDPHVQVRREAVKALERFAHDDTKALLRRVIAEEKSYKTVAAALASLAKIDPQHCRPELLAALALPSHRDELFKAAAQALNDLKDPTAPARWQAMLTEKLSADQRAAVIEAIAGAGSPDVGTLELLKRQLEHRRPNIRRQTVKLLGDLGEPQAIAWLQARRDHEVSPGQVRMIDEAIEKLRNKQQENDPVQKELDALREKNKQLEERLNKLEKN
jgi:aminopeptidase N